MHDMLYGPLDHEPRAQNILQADRSDGLLSQMSARWSPARHTDRPVDTVFYIPRSALTVLFDKLQMQASKYRLVFKHRDPSRCVQEPSGTGKQPSHPHNSYLSDDLEVHPPH